MSVSEERGARRPPLRAAHRVLVVVNANASAAPTSAERDDLVRDLRDAGADVELEQTSSLAQLEAIWRDDDGRRLVLVGGDGTIHAVANLGGPPRDIALIPAGGANNIARSTRIPRDRQLAAALAVRGRVRPVDLIEARTAELRQMVVESVSVGFLAQARVRYHGRNSTDRLAALRAGAGALREFAPLAARVTSAGGEESLMLSQLFVANLPFYEFGLRVAPQADPTDATLDLIGIEAPTRLAVLRMIADLRRGRHMPHRGVHAWRAATATVTTHGCSPIVADSSDLGFGPVVLRAAPAALRLVRP
jgi:diacylglycerol kinase (ATP)